MPTAERSNAASDPGSAEKLAAGVSPLIVALDYAEADPALELVSGLDPASCQLKVGKQLFVAAGPDLVRTLQDSGFSVFLDLKFHDIPNTVAAACRAAANLGCWMLTIHTSGGRAMLEAAREALDGASSAPLLIGVTVLTSLDRTALREIGLCGEPEDWVRRWSAVAAEAGLDGVVCSPQEAAGLRHLFGNRLLRVTPGIRLGGTGADDQRRIASPAEALAGGADYLVVGRPITQSPDPAGAIRAILSEICDSGPANGSVV
jgi:orotidine-5'-phosphate decarboxylase